jgi:hypothetical protein
LRCRLACALLVLGGGTARAFDESSAFFANPMNPHGATLGAVAEGIYFTGAPRFSGLDCSSCHAGGPQQLGVRLGATPDGLFSTGYQPGQTYEILVELTGESAGTDFSTATCTQPPGPSDKYTYVPCNNNNFALEVDDANGPLTGPAVYCTGAPVGGQCPAANPITDETLVSPEGDAVFGNRQRDPSNPKTIARNGPTSWRFYLTAPPAGSGPLTLYLGAVDGNGGDGTAANDQDVFGDDTVRAIVPLREAGDPLGGFDASAGCSAAAAGRPRGSTAAVALVFLLAALARRRLRGRAVRAPR